MVSKNLSTYNQSNISLNPSCNLISGTDSVSHLSNFTNIDVRNSNLNSLQDNKENRSSMINQPFNSNLTYTNQNKSHLNSNNLNQNLNMTSYLNPFSNNNKNPFVSTSTTPPYMTNVTSNSSPFGVGTSTNHGPFGGGVPTTNTSPFGGGNNPSSFGVTSTSNPFSNNVNTGNSYLSNVTGTSNYQNTGISNNQNTNNLGPTGISSNPFGNFQTTNNQPQQNNLSSFGQNNSTSQIYKPNQIPFSSTTYNQNYSNNQTTVTNNPFSNLNNPQGQIHNTNTPFSNTGQSLSVTPSFITSNNISQPFQTTSSNNQPFMNNNSFGITNNNSVFPNNTNNQISGNVNLTSHNNPLSNTNFNNNMQGNTYSLNSTTNTTYNPLNTANTFTSTSISHSNPINYHNAPQSVINFNTNTNQNQINLNNQYKANEIELYKRDIIQILNNFYFTLSQQSPHCGFQAFIYKALPSDLKLYNSQTKEQIYHTFNNFNTYKQIHEKDKNYIDEYLFNKAKLELQNLNLDKIFYVFPVNSISQLNNIFQKDNAYYLKTLVELQNKTVSYQDINNSVVNLNNSLDRFYKRKNLFIRDFIKLTASIDKLAIEKNKFNENTRGNIFSKSSENEGKLISYKKKLTEIINVRESEKLVTKGNINDLYKENVYNERFLSDSNKEKYKDLNQLLLKLKSKYLEELNISRSNLEEMNFYLNDLNSLCNYGVPVTHKY